MPAAVLVPSCDHPAIEERYAQWQSRMLLRRDHAVLHVYDPGARAASAVDSVAQDHVLVVTDPLLLPSPRLGERLQAVLGDAFAAVPVANQAGEPRQQVDAGAYSTLREFERRAAELDARERGVDNLRWRAHDPGAFLCRTASLRALAEPLQRVCAGRDVAIGRGAYVHRWASLRGQTRLDLLDRIPADARTILECGCGEASLGAALKQRQPCRVVGVELDPAAAAIARARVDHVHCGDVRDIVPNLTSRFDCIVAGDVVEHIADPWSFLGDLRQISTPGGQLLLSLPNVANASVIGDLLQGRLDYVYMGLMCAGHLRFFTRRTVEEMLTIAGWDVRSVDPQSLPHTAEHKRLLDAMRTAGIPFAEAEVTPSGFYVTARNPA